MGNAALCKEAIKKIAEARESGANVLTADIALEGLSDWHVPVVETVLLEATIAGNDGFPIGGDIYLQAKSETPSKRRYAISRQGLSKLAVAAGVIWSASETRRTDNRACRDYVSFQAVGGIKKPDGTYAFIKAEYDLDLEVAEEEMVSQKKKDWEIKKDMIQKRKHKLKLCESGAKDRVIRELLGIKATYPLEQISKPFVIMRITVRPDYNDQEVKRAMLTAAIQSMTGIYGSAPAPQISYDDPIDITPTEPEPEPEKPPHPEAQKEDDPPFTVEIPGASAEVDFKDSSSEDQVRTLESMMKRKGYLASNLKKALDKFTATERLGFFTHLNGQPDKEAA